MKVWRDVRIYQRAAMRRGLVFKIANETRGGDWGNLKYKEMLMEQSICAKSLTQVQQSRSYRSDAYPVAAIKDVVRARVAIGSTFCQWTSAK